MDGLDGFYGDAFEGIEEPEVEDHLFEFHVVWYTRT